MNDDLAFETLAIHAGQEPDPAYGAVMPPVYLTSTFRQEAVGVHKGFEYSRSGNPTRSALERTIAALENGKVALAFASGMAAIDAVIHLLKPGDHILAADDLYGGTHRLFHNVYAQFDIEATYANAADAAAFVAKIRPETRLIWIETPTNPLLNLCDLSAISAGAKEVNPEAWIAVDNTFATPYLQQPLKMGADLVMHSTTKYLGGHSDVVGGALVLGEGDAADRLRFLQNAVGATPGPLDCYLVLRGIKTLPLRMERHASNAEKVASFLLDRSEVQQVIYPGLPSHPQHALAKRQMRNGGGMVSFIPHGGAAAARAIVESTHLFALAESLGAVESLIEIPAAMTHASASQSPIATDPALIRLSIGIEAAEDLIADLEQAFSGLK